MMRLMVDAQVIDMPDGGMGTPDEMFLQVAEKD
jgi:hypothetical protein